MGFFRGLTAMNRTHQDWTCGGRRAHFIVSESSWSGQSKPGRCSYPPTWWGVSRSLQTVCGGTFVLSLESGSCSAWADFLNKGKASRVHSFNWGGLTCCVCVGGGARCPRGSMIWHILTIPAEWVCEFPSYSNLGTWFLKCKWNAGLCFVFVFICHTAG